MKGFFSLIAILIFKEVLNKSVNVQEISLQEEIEFYPESGVETLTNNSEYYFILENDGENKNIQIRTYRNEEAEFEVLFEGYDEKPSEEQVLNSLNYIPLELVEKQHNNINDMYGYYISSES